MSRRSFLSATDQLIATGDAILEDPGWDAFRAWLLESDRLLEAVWAGWTDITSPGSTSGATARRLAHCWTTPARAGSSRR